jgi:hypothetical protein
MSTTEAMNSGTSADTWPALPYDGWNQTRETLHMWAQIVGKVRLALSPHVNHWWHVPLYVTARGLTTSPVPYRDRIFEVMFDFIDHDLLIATSAGTTKALPLIPRSVADFYHEFMASPRALGIEVTINPTPCEVPHPIPYDQDQEHAAYDPAYPGLFTEPE